LPPAQRLPIWLALPRAVVVAMAAQADVVAKPVKVLVATVVVAASRIGARDRAKTAPTPMNALPVKTALFVRFVQNARPVTKMPVRKHAVQPALKAMFAIRNSVDNAQAKQPRAAKARLTA
jgi:hypothetical protein